MPSAATCVQCSRTNKVSYLCFDIGSSSLKAALVSEKGDLLASSRRPLSIIHGPSGVHESDACSWVEAAFSAGAEAISLAERALAEHHIPKLEVRAISVSGNGPSLLAVDSSGHPLGPALSWLDRRAVVEAEEVSKLAGFKIDPTFYLPKALRMWRTSDEELRDRIRWFFSCPEYIVFMLCGEALTYLPDPGYEPYIWNSDMIAALGLPLERFPPFSVHARIVGRLIPAAASRLGLNPEIPLVSGYPDFLAAIVGSASVDIGDACDRSGTSEAINLCALKPFPRRDLLSLPHPIAGLWNLSGGISTAGAALAWLSNILNPQSGHGDAAPVDSLLHEAHLSPPGAHGLVFLPYLAGERAPIWDASLRGAFVGLSIDHDRSDLARAAAEALAYGLKLASDLARSESFPFKILRVSGSSALDNLLCEIKADVLGVPVEVPEIVECELVGDAAACASALGDASDLYEASHALVRIARSFEPHSIKAYSDTFGKFMDALEALESTGSSSVSRLGSAATEIK
jgi:xylulokinase